MFPADEILIARGKYSTLSKERREQLERVQGICTTLITTSQHVLRDCEAKAENVPQLLDKIENCLDNVRKARERILTLNLGMDELRDEAWG